MDKNRMIRGLKSYGIATVDKLSSLRILISGLRGPGIEAAKNLISSGVGSICLHDDSLVQIQDLSINSYISEFQIGMPRSEASISGLRKLNPLANLSIRKGPISSVENLDLVVLTESDAETISRVNRICRSHTPSIGFISCENWGIFGYIFVDFGESFSYIEEDHEVPRQGIITNIRQSNPGIVLSENHGLESGIYVVLKKVQGMEELSDKTFKVEVQDKDRFSICDTTHMPSYARNGYFIEVYVKETISFEPWETSFENPNDLLFLNRDPYLLHLTHKAIRIFQTSTGSLPELLNQAHAEQLLKIVYEINAQSEKPIDISPKFIRNVSLHAQAQVLPICKIWGGFLAHEAIKITGNLMPVHQWSYLEFSDCFPKNTSKLMGNSELDHQIALIGDENSEKLGKLSICIAKSNEAGREVLKMLSMMGVSSSQGRITILDKKFTTNPTQDNIEMRKNSSVIQSIPYDSNSQEQDFPDEFWESLDIIIGFQNSLPKRKYRDLQSVHFEKTLIDCEVSGNKGACKIVVPHLTACLAELKEENTQPIYSVSPLKFPFTQKDCAIYEVNTFDSYFDRHPQLINEMIRSVDKLNSELESTSDLERIYHYFLLMNERSPEICIRYAFYLHKELFFTRVVKLLEHIPPDKVTDTGELFWSGYKLLPHPIEFNIEDPLHVSFVLSTANLLCEILGLPEIPEIMNISEKSNCFMNSCASEEEMKRYILDSQERMQSLELKRLTFNRYDQNHQLHYLHSASVLRARSYNIEEMEIHEIPKLLRYFKSKPITLISMISGFVGLGVYSSTWSKRIDHFCNSSVNLALPFVSIHKPDPPKRNKSVEFDPTLLGPLIAYPENWNCWDKFYINACTLQELIHRFFHEHQVIIYLVFAGEIVLYNKFLPMKRHKDRMKKFIHEIYAEVSKKEIDPGKRSLSIEVAGERFIDETDISMPPIKYIFK